MEVEVEVVEVGIQCMSTEQGSGSSASGCPDARRPYAGLGPRFGGWVDWVGGWLGPLGYARWSHPPRCRSEVPIQGGQVDWPGEL